MTSRIHTRSVSPRLNVLAACMTVVLGTGIAASSAWAAEIATPRSNHADIGQGLLAQPFHPFRHAHGHNGAPAPSTAAATSRASTSFAVNSCTDASLRAALALATTDGDVVDMSALTCSTITLTDGALTSTAEVTLQGPGQNKLTIDGNAADRVLTADKSLTVRDLTISNGQAQVGGCLYVTGDLNLYDTTISGCVAGSQTVGTAAGGGAAVDGDLNMQSSTLSGNTVTSTGIARGGGAALSGYAALDDSVISGNTATSTNPVASSKYGLVQGGGLAANGVGLYGSVISNNRASVIKGLAYGGGVNAFVPTYGGSGAAPTQLLVVSVGSTISGNTAHSDTGWTYGGGVAVGKGMVEIVPGSGAAGFFASTVSGNTVSSDCSDCTIQGGGVSAFGQVQLDHSTVRDNQAVLTSSSTGVAYGGGVATRLNSSSAGNDFYDGSIFTDHSTISGNSAVGGTAGDGRGGGLAALVSPLVLENSTISFNQASSSGLSMVLIHRCWDWPAADQPASTAATCTRPRFCMLPFCGLGGSRCCTGADAGNTISAFKVRASGQCLASMPPWTGFDVLLPRNHASASVPTPRPDIGYRDVERQWKEPLSKSCTALAQRFPDRRRAMNCPWRRFQRGNKGPAECAGSPCDCGSQRHGRSQWRPGCGLTL